MFYFIRIFILFFSIGWCQSSLKEGLYRIAQLKYGGGGDWYANPTSLPNLLRFVRENSQIPVALDFDYVELTDPSLFSYPLVYATGHGNIEFSEEEVQILRLYLESGGFLFLDDNYGLHKYAMREMKKVLPEVEPVTLPPNHPIFHAHYSFPEGLPKIHEHDGKPAQLFGWYLNGRLVAILTYEADLGDGWEDPSVHHDPEPIRQMALKMGLNVLAYVFNPPN